MAEWLVERGIAEHRALFVEANHVIAVKLLWPGELYPGQRIEAQLTSKLGQSRRGLATTPSGQEALVDHLPTLLTEGQNCTLEVTRAGISEKGRFKRAISKIVPDLSEVSSQWLADARDVASFENGAWEDVWDAASSGEVSFNGGSLIFSVTPAMTLIDVDGEGSPRELALAAVPAIAKWLRLFDLGGNIGIDFPTLEAKADRKAVDTALAEALADWPHECTAMNGFGFVQLVARLEGPSLLHRFATSRTGMCARMAIRRAELAAGVGPVILLTVHPALKAKIKPEWQDELSRRTGKKLRIETDPSLALEASQAQILSE